MLLHITDLSSEPLHAQISRQIRSRVLDGTLREGDSLPSIRVMAKELRVSVITVQRAYEDLDREGIIYSKRGKGFFTADLSKSQKQNMASERLMENLQSVLNDAFDDGLDNVQIQEVVQAILNKRGGSR